MSMTGGVSWRSQLTTQNLVDMRKHLDDLQRQLGSGQKSKDHAGLGLDRGLAVSLRGQLSALDAYSSTMTLVGVHLNVAETTLSRMMGIRADAKAALLQSPDIKTSGQTVAQQSARGQLDELVELLQTKVGDRYLFGGRAVDKPPVATSAQILDGDGGRAGLKQVVAERAAADLGADGMGRLVLATTANSVSLSEDVAGSPFGLKLAAVAETFTGATASGPTGAPPALDVTFTGNPLPGESITLTLDLPDGTRETIKLVATSGTPSGPGEFAIGATPAETAANFGSVLETAVGKLAKTSLAAASAVVAADDFFNVDLGQPPKRVAGPPFETATALVDGTQANTVHWYKGEMSADPARSSAVARIDASVTASYGMRANEEGIRWVVQHVAAFAAVSFDPNDASSPERYAALTDRLGPAFAGPPGVARVEDIATELAGTQITLQATKDRHLETGHLLSGLLEDVSGVPTEQVAMEILALQTRLQASLQVTSMVYQLNLTNYI